jgi:glycosyltransferase involved in cell wall biosynthesis
MATPHASRLKVWHVGATPSPHTVDGVSAVVWLVAKEQAALGHEVTLLLNRLPSPDLEQAARAVGLQLACVPSRAAGFDLRRLGESMRANLPHVVHMHSVFSVDLTAAAFLLRRLGVPYVVTPHGGLSGQVLVQRRRFKKKLYSLIAERPRLRRAAAITVVTPGEAADVRRFVPHYPKAIHWVPNPINLTARDGCAWRGQGEASRLVFLGRFDVMAKGIDRLVEIARRLPQVNVHLYGIEDPKTRDWLRRLKQNLPPNVFFHSPVFGMEKAAALAGASMYIQPSRWEGFPLSVAEAMYLKVPCAVSGTVNFAELFREHNLGMVLPADPAEAASRLRAALADADRLRSWSERSADFARHHFYPPRVAEGYLDVYRTVLAEREVKDCQPAPAW